MTNQLWACLERNKGSQHITDSNSSKSGLHSKHADSMPQTTKSYATKQPAETTHRMTVRSQSAKL
jgi:hypothetical protein